MSYTPITPFIVDQAAFSADVNEWLKNIEATLALRIGVGYLGGSRSQPLKVASFTVVPEYIDVELDGTEVAGITVRARVEVRTTNASTSVQPRIVEVDAAGAFVGVLVTGAAYNADTNWDRQTLVFTPLTGVHFYRLEIVGGDALNNIFGIGPGIERFV